MRRNTGPSPVWVAFKRTLLLVLTLGLLAYLGYQMLQYLQVRRSLPEWTTIGDVPVGGLSLEEAGERVAAIYAEPVILVHRGEALELNPADVGFTLDMDTMLAEAEHFRTSQDFWRGYLFHVIGWTWEPMDVPLRASLDAARLRQMIEIVAGWLDEPATGPQILAETSAFRQGKAGFTTDIDASIPLVEEALYQPEGRTVQLVIADQEAVALTLDVLEDAIRGQLERFDGLGLVYVQDLQTGEEIMINSDAAISATSVLKIAIFMEAYRALDDPPNEYVEGLFYDTAAKSSNFGANLLLHVVAGEDNTYQGADILTESMRRLGLVNTFMAVPYDAAAPPHRPYTYATEANSRPDATEDIDPTMQTTPEEIGALLSMIYYCSKGGGTLLAVYPDQLTPEECQSIIDLMILNEEGNLIRYGVPAGTPVSHKHGWARGTHADAGIVLSPGGDYVLVEYLHRPGSWLEADESFPILREISRAVYNYFNFDEPYLGDPLRQVDTIGEPFPIPEVAEEDSEPTVIDRNDLPADDLPTPAATAPAASDAPPTPTATPATSAP